MEQKTDSPDHYVNHLSDVNTNNKLIATESIHNEFGVLLVPKGTAIEHRVLDFLTGHKMQEQLDELLTIEGCLTNTTLQQEFYTFLTKYPDVAQLHESSNFGQTLKHLCTVQQIPRILLQKLTVLKIQLPVVFEQTLFSTLLGCMLAKEMKFEQKALRNIFYIGLLHDLGLLHIDPALVSKQGEFSDEEWRTLKSHMMISVAIAKSIYPFDDEVFRGIREHHERCDGTGYPKELHREQLCISGQLIGLADIVCHIRTRQYNQSGKSMANIMPYIQINLHSFKFESYQAIYSILRGAKLELTDLLDRKNFITMPKRLILQRVRISQLHQVFSDFVAEIPKEIKGKHCLALLDSCKHLTDTIKRAGFNSSETLDWLENINDDDYIESHLELQELDDMHYELLWLFKKTFRIIPDFLNEELPTSFPLLAQFEAQSATMQQNLLSAWTDYS